MSAEADFRAALAGHAGTSALVGTRIALNAVPEGADYPLVVFASSHAPQYTLDNTLAADIVTFDTQCWAETAVQANDLADQVTEAAATINAIVVGRASTFDAELGLDAVALNIELIV